MTDIYHALQVHDLSWAEDDVVEDRHSAYFAAGSAIDSALRVIGNLVLEAEGSEGYTNEEAKRDLELTGDVLRSLPRMAQVLKQNGRIAALELQKRQGGAK
ncbi:hypothetical protein [Serratia liquefaciens]|uniref:hypothetical protein n=1 Tax=Serratia liquefaciens TaxID=614 RepID=UPI00390607EC